MVQMPGIITQLAHDYETQQLPQTLFMSVLVEVIHRANVQQDTRLELLVITHA